MDEPFLTFFAAAITNAVIHLEVNGNAMDKDNVHGMVLKIRK